MRSSAVERTVVERRRLTGRIIALSVAQLGAVPIAGDVPAAAAHGDGQRSRRDLITGAVQRLADLGARAEGRTLRPVPGIADRALADQLGVMIDDLVAVGSEPELRDGLDILVGLRRAL